MVSGDGGARPHVSIWSLPEHGGRGPKPRHSRAEIAAAAVRVADAEGLDAVTMRRIAQDVGMGTMTLYNYVPTKEHVVELMIDHVAAEYRYPDPPAADPRAGMLDLAVQGREIARRHPWLARAQQRPPSLGPAALRYMDHVLALFAGVDADPGAKLEVLALVNGFAIQYGSLQAALVEEQRRTGVTAEQQAAQQGAVLAAAAASGRYPHLAAALAQPSAPRDEEAVFASAVLRLVDGLLRG